jgi:hypothetical protein
MIPTCVPAGQICDFSKAHFDNATLNLVSSYTVQERYMQGILGSTIGGETIMRSVDRMIGLEGSC